MRHPDVPPEGADPSSMPPAVRIADALTAVLIVLGLLGAIGGFRLRTSFGGLSVGSPWPSWILAAAVAALRHRRLRAPSFAWRAWLAVSRPSQALKAALLVAVTTRLAVLVIGILAVAAIGPPPTPDGGGPTRAVHDLPARWDAGWYGGIAASGYVLDPNRTQQPVVFFPAFPMLMRVGGEVLNTVSRGLASPSLLGGRPNRMLWGGVLVSLLGFTAALVVLYKLARQRGYDDDRATLFLFLLASYPFALFFSAPYSESLFLFSAAAAMYSAHGGKLLACAAAGLLAGLSRPHGFLLAIPVALVFAPGLRAEAASRLRGKLLAAAAPVIGMLLYSAYVYSLTGTPWGWVQAQSGWEAEVKGFAFVVRPLQEIWYGGLEKYILLYPVDALSRVAILFAVGMLWPVWRRLGAPYLALAVLYLVPALAIDLYAVGRITSVLFPVFLALADVLPQKGRYPCLVVFAMLQGLASVLFFASRSLY